MSVVIEECAYQRKITVVPDKESVPFVAKIQKARTRKNKDYFVLRTTIPKDVSEKIGVKAGEFLFFRAKKAQWYHMLDWKMMKDTWAMLPENIRGRVILDGLYGQGLVNQSLPGATNMSASLPETYIQVTQTGEFQWK